MVICPEGHCLLCCIFLKCPFILIPFQYSLGTTRQKLHLMNCFHQNVFSVSGTVQNEQKKFLRKIFKQPQYHGLREYEGFCL